MILRYLLRDPRKLHRGDAVAWLVVIAVAGAALAGCETAPPCDPYYAGNTQPPSIGCRPHE
jgi:hypothetical protein